MSNHLPSIRLGDKLLQLLKVYQSYSYYFVDLIRWRIFRLIDYKSVEICADTQDNLIIIPSGATVELISEIRSPLKDNLLAAKLLKAIGRSKYQDSNNPLQENVLEKYLGIKDYEEAIQGRRLVFFSWSRKEGYSLTPTKGLHGSNYYELPRILLGKKMNTQKLVEVTRQALKLSTPPG